MKKLMLALYPFLIACYPVLALRNYNINYVDFASIFRTLILVIILTALVWLVVGLFVRDQIRSGILTSLMIILAFAYGHIYIQSEKILGEPVRHGSLVILLGIIFLSIVWLVHKYPSAGETISNFLITTAVTLFLMSVGQSLFYEYSAYRAMKILSAEDDPSGVIINPGNHPDIYLIVLDAHGRADRLQEEFDYDSSAFIRELNDMKFYVADCSQSNYASTNLSLSSLFQMNYIPPILSDTARLPPLKESIVNLTVVSNGYTVITFENRASGHFDLQEDIRLSQNQLALGEFSLMGGLNEFEKIMLNTSITRLFLDAPIIPGFNKDGLTKLEDFEHYTQTRFILSKLQEVPQLKGPKFVFVHILVPHSPYVFTADGKFRSTEDKSKQGYRDNVEFIDTNILPAIHAILDKSEQPPIVILMGDHGPPPGKRFATREARMSILNAIYADDVTKAQLYNSISPINSFRVIFNRYFGGNYPILDDLSYFAYKLNQLAHAPIVENTCNAPE